MVGFLSVVYSGFRTNHRVPSILIMICIEIALHQTPENDYYGHNEC